MSKFDQLVEDLLSGDMTIRLMGMAYCEYLRRNKNIPDGVKNLLAPHPEKSRGIIRMQFEQISKTVGDMELAYRRGEQNVIVSKITP